MRWILLFFGLTYICLVQCYIDTQYNNYVVQAPSQDGDKYQPDWKDLDKRPLPQWYDRAKIGIFLHWGVYSVPSFHSEWFWTYWKDGASDIKNFMLNNYPVNFTYQEFAPMFRAEFFEPAKLATLFAKSGAKYIVLTSKHHEGYTLFPSKRSFSWNSVDVGPHRDLVREVATAVRKEGLKFGVYHSLYEWYNPIYISDKSTNFTERTYVDEKLWPDIKQLIQDYKPSVLWADGDWEAKDSYWKSQELLAWLYNDSPVKNEVVVNDRWGIGVPCKHGDFFNCEDRYNPGKLQNHKWENAFTVDKKSWGYRRNMDLSEVLTMTQILTNVISTISCGGNALINVGPTKEGTIAPIFEERLLSLGKWLEINGEGIYGSSPWLAQNDTFNGNVWYTCVKTEFDALHTTAVPKESDTILAVYAFFLEWPESNNLYLKSIADLVAKNNWRIQMLGYSENYLEWALISQGKIAIRLPGLEKVKSESAWTLKFTPPSDE